MYWVAVFFKICSQIFMILEVKLEYWFGHAKKEMEQKSEQICGVKVFRYKLKVE